MALPATDTFTNDDGTQIETHNANWDNYNNLDIQSNAVAPDGTGNVENSAAWEGDAFDADQYSEGEIVLAGAAVIGVSVRDDGAGTYYGWYSSGAISFLFKMIAGAWTQLSNDGGNVAVNEVMRLEISGVDPGTLLPLIEGVEEDPPGDQNDSDIDSGSAGLCGYGDLVNRLIDNWEGGNMGGAAVITERGTGRGVMRGVGRGI